MGAGGSTAAQEAVWERMETRRQESIAFAAEHAAGWAELQEAFGKDTKVLSVASSAPPSVELTEYDAIRTRPWNKDCHGCVLSSLFSKAQSLLLRFLVASMPLPIWFPFAGQINNCCLHHIAVTTAQCAFLVASHRGMCTASIQPPHCYGWAARTAQLQDVSFSHDVMGVHRHTNTGKTKLTVIGAMAPLLVQHYPPRACDF